jgi:catechol 2,3-dioxygenase-like lactoylglutathione lyase family enzyme
VKIEHTAYQVADPVALTKWYVAHLGMRVKRAQDAPPFGVFLADDGDTVMLEFYANPKVSVPNYASMDPLLLHLAFRANDVAAERARLIAAGATAGRRRHDQRDRRHRRDVERSVGTRGAVGEAGRSE